MSSLAERYDLLLRTGTTKGQMLEGLMRAWASATIH